MARDKSALVVRIIRRLQINETSLNNSESACCHLCMFTLCHWTTPLTQGERLPVQVYKQLKSRPVLLALADNERQ